MHRQRSWLSFPGACVGWQSQTVGRYERRPGDYETIVKFVVVKEA